MKLTLAITLLTVVLYACNETDSPDTDSSIITTNGVPAPANLMYSVMAQHPHDTGAYTQGLQWHNGKLYEGTGDYEKSSLRITNYKTGNVEQQHKMGSDQIFGEGICILNDKIYQLTWQSNIVYVYDINNINKPIQTFNWPYEGWGITHNGTDLIISDGSSNLYFVNPTDFKVKTTIAVRTDKGPIDNLNELEYIDGFVYANVYFTDAILKINPNSGIVAAVMNMSNLLPENEKVPQRTDVLNGIAYDSTSKTLFITGKRWPKLYEIKLN
jgi:glutamine cyclotransferase